MSARSDRIGRYFARHHDMSSSDCKALLHIMVAETAGDPLTSSQLRQRMDVSPAAVTYLVDRMVDAGHIRREADPGDRRKSLLRSEAHGMAVGRAFFRPLGAHLRSAVADMHDKDLVAAHRVLTAMTEAMSTFEEELKAPRRRPAKSKTARSSQARRRRQVKP
jgi:DNA-binding MarR family transcriptional regulator